MPLAFGLLLALSRPAAAQAGAPQPDAGAKAEPVDRRPYKIQVHVAIDPEVRIDRRRREALLADWLDLVERFVGTPWDLTLAAPGAAVANLPLESLGADAFPEESRGFDKVWVLQVGPEGAGLALSGREFDVATGRVGPIQRQPAPYLPDVPRALFRLALDVFSPSAVIGEKFAKDVNLTVRGASLEAASPVGRVVTVGTLFQPLRLVPRKDGKTRVLDIPFSYLRVEALEGPVARCSLFSIYADPLTDRIVQKTALAALGVKPGKSPTRLRFVTREERAPAAGYTLTARASAEGLPSEVGLTDREGRIVIPPEFADGLVILRLLAGNVEPMVEFPAVLGEFPGERTIPIVPRPLTVALETQLDSIRDEVLDLVAVRARLEARVKARFDGEDWAGVEATIKEFNRLPARDTFADRITRLKEEAALQQAKTKTAVLTRTAQAQLAEVQALIDRYLVDDLVKTYTEELERARSGTAAQAAPEARKKSAPPPAKPAGRPGPAPNPF